MSCKRRRSKSGELQGWAIKKKRSQVQRNWLDLPADVVLLVFLKLGVVEVLANAQRVCTLWRRLAKEPLLYRSIDFQGADRYLVSPKNSDGYMEVHLAKEAVDRSCGQLVKLSSIKGFCWDEILSYVSCTNSLKSLQLRRETYMSEIRLANVIRGLGSLEELDMHFLYFPCLAIGELGRTCHKLTSFRMSVGVSHGESSDKELFVMARDLRQLHRLSLRGFLITNKGLQTILDGFPLLEHLDLHDCWFDKGLYNKNLLRKCAAKISSIITPSLVSKDHYRGVLPRVVRRSRRHLHRRRVLYC